MLLTVLVLGSTVLGATTIAGLLMLYQVRQATDLGNSAKAIFAADAGIEQAFYNLFKCSGEDAASTCPAEAPIFTNGASVEVICFKGQEETDCSDAGITRIRSVGQGASAYRAFEASFE
jgi:hypothetical protein